MTKKREEIASLLESESERSDVFIQGWVRTRRDSKNFFFLELNDGSPGGSGTESGRRCSEAS